MIRSMCVCVLLLCGTLLLGCGDPSGTEESSQVGPASSLVSSVPEFSSQAESTLSQYPKSYVPLTGMLTTELATDVYWYFDPLIGDNVGYLSMDGTVVWNTTSYSSRYAAERYRQEHPWINTEREISTFFGNGSCAVAGGKVLGTGESWWKSESDSIGKLIANWNNVSFIIYDETLSNSGIPVGITSAGAIYGIELEEQSGQKVVFQQFLQQEDGFTMGMIEAQGYQESGCFYGILTELTAEGKLKALRFPLALGLNTISIEEVMEGGNGEAALPLPDYTAYDGVVSVQNAGFTFSGSTVGAKLILQKNGTLRCADGMGNECVVAQRIVKMAQNGLLNTDNAAGTEKLLIDEQNCVLRLRFSVDEEKPTPVLEAIGSCSDWTKIVSVQRGYAVLNDGTVERIDQTGKLGKTFFEDITDVRISPKKKHYDSTNFKVKQ